MKNGLGVNQNIVLFGGSSEIGLGILKRLLVPGVARVVLVSRDVERAQSDVADLAETFVDVEFHHQRWDGADAMAMGDVVSEIVSAIGDIDVAVIAQGLLNDGVDNYVDQVALVEMANVNFTATMALMYALAAQMKAQGYGKMVLLSSVAGVRVRRANAAYGATKAGIDGFALALDHELEGSGASVLVVRPGFVTTKMTEGMKKAPLSTDVETVANATVRALAGSTKVVWVPGALRVLFGVLKIVPLWLWRRLPI